MLPGGRKGFAVIPLDRNVGLGRISPSRFAGNFFHGQFAGENDGSLAADAHFLFHPVASFETSTRMGRIEEVFFVFHRFTLGVFWDADGVPRKPNSVGSANGLAFSGIALI